jgi:hypothetical protein
MSAQLSPTQEPPVQNFAPIKPLMELQRGGKKPSSRLGSVLKERFGHFQKKDNQVFRGIFNVGQLISHFINGEQFPVRNPIDGSWGVLPIMGNSNSTRRSLNIMNNLKQNLIGKWENSNPDIIIRPGRNLDTCVSAAKAADTINDYYERQFYNHWFTQQEGLMGMIFGTYIDRYRFDDSKVSMSVIQDIFEQKEATFGDGVGFCGDCQYGGKANEFQMPPNQEEMGALGGNGPLAAGQACPNCQSTAVMVESPATDSIYSMSGRQEKQIGDLVCELLPLPACRWDLAKRPEDSNYFIYNQRIPRGAVTRVLGNVLLPQGETDRDYGLDVLEVLNKQGTPIGGHATSNSRSSFDDKERTDEVTFNEFWMSPDCYADVSLMGDEETVDGETIPKGKLTDVFPDGLCAVGLNGMSVVLALYPEKHKNHIVSGTWFMQSQTGAGRGLADSVEVQKQFNTLNNQALEYMSSTYTPAIMYDNQLLTGNKMKYIGTSKTNIPVDLTKLPEGRKLADAIHQMQPTAMPAQFFNYSQNFMTVMAQKTSLASDFSNGEPGITAINTTATAAEIDQGNADALNEPIFLIKGDCRVRGTEITINLFRQHFPMKRYFDLGGKYGEQQGIELSSADLRADLSYELDKGSVMPKGPYTRRKNLISFYGVLGGAEGVAVMEQTNPRLLSNTAQEFDVDIEINDFDAVAELCRRRLDQMKQATKAGVTDPTVLITEAIQPPISAKELDLGGKGKWFASWLSTDEGLNSPMSLRIAAELLADGQIRGQVTQDAEAATQAGMVAAAGQAPLALGAHALEQDAAQQPESTEPDPSAQLQYAQEQSTQQHEAEQNAADRAHEEKMLDKEHSNVKEEAKVDADHKIRIEKNKPRPKMASKGKP